MQSFLKDIDKIGVTVVIVTYNGRKRIIPTLEHLSLQKEINFNWEVLLIDNKSTDQTADQALSFWTSKPRCCDLRIIHENKPGTMWARQRGIQEACYRYLLFCDDDNWLNENYVRLAFESINKNQIIAAVGGKGIMEYESGFSPPGWIEKFAQNYGTGPQGVEDGNTTFSKGCLYSAGAIFDRAWIDKLYKTGFKSSLVGRDGKTLRAGEDTELTFALKAIGGELHYCSKMTFKHYMPGKRIQWRHLKKMWNAFGYTDFIISPYNDTVKSFYYRYYFEEFYDAVKKLFKSYFLIIREQHKEGSILILKKERLKGKVKAMLFEFKKYRENKKYIKSLETTQ